MGFSVQADNQQVDIAHHEMFSAKAGKVGKKLHFGSRSGPTFCPAWTQIRSDKTSSVGNSFDNQ